jgi:hypothetical protein
MPPNVTETSNCYHRCPSDLTVTGAVSLTPVEFKPTKLLMVELNQYNFNEKYRKRKFDSLALQYINGVQIH